MTEQPTPAEDPIEGNSGAKPWQLPLICFMLAVIVFAVFGQTLGHQFINFDDDQYVVDNTMVNQGLTFKGVVWAFSHVYASNWHPLTWISHELDCQLYGLHPGGHHLTNVLLHAATAIVLFLVLRQMTGALWRSAFVAAVFAIHPLRAESVAWVAERKDVLSGLFFMLTLAAYVRYARSPRSMAKYGLVMLLFALGLMCKPMLVSIPVVLLLLDYWPLQRTEPVAKLILEKLPFLALSAASCLITLMAQHKAMSPIEHYPLSLRILDALLACRVYLLQLVYPAGLVPFYPFPRTASLWDGLMAGTLLVVISAVTWGERQKKPWLLVGWGWFLVMLLPVVGIVQVGSQAHADRYTYLPEIGLGVALTWLAAEVCIQFRVIHAAIATLMVAVLAVLMACTWRQTSYWKTSETLWRHTLDCDPKNHVALLNLGHDLYRQGRVDETIAHYLKALEIEPNGAEFHNNLGNALREKGRMDEAMLQYDAALKAKPNFTEAQFNLGKALGLKGQVAEAIARYERALQIQPDFLPAHVSLGNALMQQGKAEQAAAHFETVLRSRPFDAGMHLNLGLCYDQLGRLDEAKEEYQKALQITPNDTGIQNNLAWLLASCPVASLRDGNMAVELARRASERTGGKNPIILRTLAAALAEAGRFPEAAETVQRASQLVAQSNPDLARDLQLQLKLYQTGVPFHEPLRNQGK